MNCGSPLTLRCANCGAELPSEAVFCPRCGHKVADPPSTAPDSPEGTLRRFIPPELLEKLELADSSGASLGERRTVTMLFSDLQGSTTAAEHLDPEDWSEIMNGAFERLIAPIYQYEGTVARMMGDAILAFFGAPIGHEDDPERAVRAGLEILAQIKPYRREVKKRWRVVFDVRVGVNTGRVVVGPVGSDLRVEYTAMGDAVNVAARMEQTAAPGTVQISEATRRLVEGLFEFEALGAVDVKGRSKPVEAHRVVGAVMRPDTTRGIPGLRAPMVGRADQLDALVESLDHAISGQGRIVSVAGEAGLGKSRLITEARDVVMNRESVPEWILVPALSYESAIPFTLTRRLIRGLVGMSDEAEPASVWTAIHERIREVLPGRSSDIEPFLGMAAGAAVPEEFGMRIDYLEPDRLRGEIFRSLIEFLEGTAARTPLVVVLEDLHWADASSIEVVIDLLDLAERGPIALVLAYRPRRQEPSWSVREAAERDHSHRHRIIELEALPEDESRELVSALLNVDALPEMVRSTILARAEGNPFFLEEVIRSMIDRQLVYDEDGRWLAHPDLADVTIPDTLSAVITTRLDELDERARSIVQAGSVLGREFRYDELTAVLDDISGADESLVTLQRRDILREVARTPKRVFRFKHALTQEAIYETLLLRRRSELHARVGRHLERIQPERSEDIADHLLAGGLPESALPFLVAAGGRALRTQAIPEATARFRRALEILDAGTDASPEIVRGVLEGLGRTREAAFDFAAAIDAYTRLREAGERVGDLDMALSGRNKAAFVTGMMLQNLEGAFAELTEIEASAREAGRSASLAETCMYQCSLHAAVGAFDAVEHYMGELARVGEELDDVETMLFGLTHLANTLALSLRPEEAIREATRGLALAEESGHLKWQSELLTSAIPLAHLQRNEIADALRAAERGIEIATRIGNKESEGWAALIQGGVAMMRGDLEDALVSFRRADTAYGESGMPWVVPLGQCMLASCYDRIGGRFAELAMELGNASLESLKRPLSSVFGGWIRAEIGHCLLTAGHLDEAEDLFRQVRDLPTMGRMIGSGDALRGMCLVAIQRGDVEAAANHLASYREFVESHELSNHRIGLLVTEAELAAAVGDHAAALDRLDACVDTLHDLDFRRVELDVQAARMRALEAVGDGSGFEKAASAFQQLANDIAGRFRDDELRAAFSTSVAAVTPSGPSS